jgi:hypothetical protein
MKGKTFNIMKYSLLFLIAFPALVSCNTPDVSPKEKTSVESPLIISSYTQSPMVGHYVKVSNESNIFLPNFIDITSLEQSSQILLNEGIFEIISTSNPAHLHNKEDLAFVSGGVKSVEIIHDWQLTTTGEDLYQLIITYWGNDMQSQPIISTANYKKSL